jgi:5-methylcytosine-specific restriction endonuclease McrA
MSTALLLNATYEPLAVVPMRRAVVLVLARKAVVVEHGASELRSARQSIRVPAVIRLTRFVKVPYRRKVPLTRSALLARDSHRCAYCRGTATTMDHVVPRSRGGYHEWTNVVAACSRCNSRKGDRLVHEIGWTLAAAPKEPVVHGWVVVGVARVDPSWTPYLEGWAARTRPMVAASVA